MGAKFENPDDTTQNTNDDIAVINEPSSPTTTAPNSTSSSDVWGRSSPDLDSNRVIIPSDGDTTSSSMASLKTRVRVNEFNESAKH